MTTIVIVEHSLIIETLTEMDFISEHPDNDDDEIGKRYLPSQRTKIMVSMDSDEHDDMRLSELQQDGKGVVSLILHNSQLTTFTDQNSITYRAGMSAVFKVTLL